MLLPLSILEQLLSPCSCRLGQAHDLDDAAWSLQAGFAARPAHAAADAADLDSRAAALQAQLRAAERERDTAKQQLAKYVLCLPRPVSPGSAHVRCRLSLPE